MRFSQICKAPPPYTMFYMCLCERGVGFVCVCVECAIHICSYMWTNTTYLCSLCVCQPPYKTQELQRVMLPHKTCIFSSSPHLVIILSMSCVCVCLFRSKTHSKTRHICIRAIAQTHTHSHTHEYRETPQYIALSVTDANANRTKEKCGFLH